MLPASAISAEIPDDRLTPGRVVNMTRERICTTAWGRDVRHVSEAMKREVRRRYGVPEAEKEKVEIDHRVPRSLGGADTLDNLSAQEWPAAHRKDRLEVRMHRDYCAGRVTLKDAQAAFLGDWRAAYRQVFGQPRKQP